MIALAKGGVLDSVQPLGSADEPSGVLFEQTNPAAMANAIAALEHNSEKFIPEKIRQHALNFDSSVFLQKFIDLLEQTLG